MKQKLQDEYLPEIMQFYARSTYPEDGHEPIDNRLVETLKSKLNETKSLNFAGALAAGFPK
jgi:hypothetical protein